MEQKYSEIFDKKIMQAVSAYCKLNSIEDVDEFIKKCFESGFNIEKYGLLGKTLNEGEKQLIKEIIVEKRVEVPVEVIKEVEKIVEVVKEIVVEKEIIKEVPVEVVKEIEKVITITNNKELEEKIFHLNEQIKEESKIFSTKTQEMENNFQKEMSKKDEEIIKLRQTLDISVDDNKVKMLQQTIQNLNTEIRELKKKNEELNKKLLEQPKQLGDIPAKFHGSSNLNDDLYK
jgi:predicted RNase H-like nuclease (RuvC/YqgF family)